MGICCSEPVNFDGEVDLYHFDLHRAVGKGAFGKVRRLGLRTQLALTPGPCTRSESSNTKSTISFMPSSTLTSDSASLPRASYPSLALLPDASR